MKNAIRKTEKEMEQEKLYQRIKCGDYQGYRDDFWYCYRCHVLFEADDEVLKYTLGEKDGLSCPLLRPRPVKNFFSFKSQHLAPEPCLNDLMCASREYFESRYKITEYWGQPQQARPFKKGG